MQAETIDSILKEAGLTIYREIILQMPPKDTNSITWKTTADLGTSIEGDPFGDGVNIQKGDIAVVLTSSTRQIQIRL